MKFINIDIRYRLLPYRCLKDEFKFNTCW